MAGPSLTSSSTDAVGMMGPAREELSLRICGTDRDGQIIRLTSSKCLVGSARNATLRLRAAGIRPAHCLILRGEFGTVVRRLSPDTRLNGRTFRDAMLRPGDRLGIGPLEFEVLQQTPRRGHSRVLDRPSAASNEDHSDLSKQVEQIQQARAEFEAEQERFAAEKEAWSTQQERQRRELAEQAEQIQQARAELEAAQERFAAEKEAWNTRQQRQQQELAEQADTLAARAEELTQQSQCLRQERTEWERDQPPSKVEKAFDESGESDASGASGVLDRLRQEGILKDDVAEEPDKPEETPAAPAIPPAETAASAPTTESRPETGEEEEESIEDYMQRLLRRVRGESSRTAKPVARHLKTPAVAPETVGQSQPVRKAEAVAPAEAAAPAEPVKTEPPAEYVPRKPAPELSANLGAMRELANRSAHAAIDRHARRRWSRAAAGKLVVAVVAAVCALALWRWSGRGLIIFTASTAAAAVAVIWALRAAMLKRRTVHRSTRHCP